MNRNEIDTVDFLLRPNPPPFALIRRPQKGGGNNVELFIGDISSVNCLDDIKLPELDANNLDEVQDVLVLLPYRVISQRGFAATDDGMPLLVMSINTQKTLTIDNLLTRIPDHNLILENSAFDINDEEYEKIVKKILDTEIAEGKGASFVIKRSFDIDITNSSVVNSLGVFKNLLTHENGAYWTFIIYTGERTFIGATPERHVSLDDGIITMNPISGTYLYPPSGPNVTELTAFLRDKKEIEELYIVVDEELKMMCDTCDKDVWLEGPKLKQMSRLAHTEYFIHGQSSLDALEILNKTMFAPTVMGGPLESAARVIHEYEPGGRGYYSGVAALIGRKHNQRVLDSGILIRTADIDNQGSLKIAVGASLVRGSTPKEEAAETRTKVAGMLSALGLNGKKSLSSDSEVIQLLEDRNKSLSDFWLEKHSTATLVEPRLFGKKILIVDAEDTFTAMVEHQLRALGCTTIVRRFNEDYSFNDGYDFVVMGPGPGDPRDKSDRKIAHLYQAIKELLVSGQPFLAICLSHQVLSANLGLDLQKLKTPNQGAQKSIDLFGKHEQVGFYNSFSAYSNHPQISLPTGQTIADICRDPSTGEVYAIRGKNFCSIQFHAESLLTVGGVQIFQSLLTYLSGSSPEYLGTIPQALIQPTAIEGEKHKHPILEDIR